jgi:phosphonate degradation associated HDIG domain protein
MPSDSKSRTIASLFQTLALGEDRDYGTDRVTQLAHALQCARLAEETGATPASVAAALLHDIGHLINPEDQATFQRHEDARHEILGARYLEQWFGPDVTVPVSLHVDAKRYLTAVETEYYDGLSTVSKETLALQGGPFDSTEAARFRALPFMSEAVDLRRWDDGAKSSGTEVPPLEFYEPYLHAALK